MPKEGKINIKNLSKYNKIEHGQHSYQQEEEHPWLLSYSDMFTLLFCMFVVLISMAFKHLDWVKIEQMLKIFSQRQEMSLPELYEKVQQLIIQYGLQDSVNVQITSKGVEISFKEKATFDKGKAELKPEIFPILTAMARLFNEKGIDRRKIIVEGHTDSLPISTKEFPSNWELSTARAGTVVRFLTEKKLDPRRFEAVGYADTRPKVEYTHPVYGQPENRRVVIVVSPEPYTMEYIREEVSLKETEYEQVKKKLGSSPPMEPTQQSKMDEQKLSIEKEKTQQKIMEQKTISSQDFIKSKVQQQITQSQQTMQIQDKDITPEKKRLMEQYFALGQQKFKEGNYNAAIIYFKKVLEIDPNHTLSKLNIERAKKKLQQ